MAFRDRGVSLPFPIGPPPAALADCVYHLFIINFFLSVSLTVGAVSGLVIFYFYFCMDGVLFYVFYFILLDGEAFASVVRERETEKEEERES